MSAFIHDPAHIDALIGFTRRWRPAIGPFSYYHNGTRHEIKNSRDATRAGRVLLAENIRSVAYRYGEPEDSPDLPGPVPVPKVDAYEFTPRREHTAVEILKACDGYEHQACETDEWPKTEARSLIDAIRSEAIRRLPGYEDADAWAITPAE